MHRWLFLASSLLLVGPLGCNDEDKDEDKAEDDAGESKKKKSKKKKKGKKKKDGKPEVFLDCSKAKGGYLSSSKSSEAKNTIGAISRGAAAAYERESVSEEGEDPTVAIHKLCKSATPVPADGPPKGKKYQPDSSEGKDFNAGDTSTGWTCLKFLMTQPHYFQYGYNAGSGYKSTEFGLPDPGPDGFEAWAMGDLDGDGRPSLYVYTGKVNPETKMLKRSTKVSCVDPFE